MIRQNLLVLGKLVLLTVVLNILRYIPIGFLEQLTIMEPMHAPMVSQADCFDFREVDFPLSFLYNFFIWMAVVVLFHMAQPTLKGSVILKSIKVFGVCCLFFISLTAAYMNHFNLEIRIFFQYAILDALLLFSLLGLANGWLYALFFRKRLNQHTISISR